MKKLNKKSIASKRKASSKSKVKLLFNNVLILLILFFSFSVINTNLFAKRELNTKDIVVEKNQTLWNIAKVVTTKNTNLNVQNVIYDIQEINNLDDSSIYVGQVLKVPLY